MTVTVFSGPDEAVAVKSTAETLASEIVTDVSAGEKVYRLNDGVTVYVPGSTANE